MNKLSTLLLLCAGSTLFAACNGGSAAPQAPSNTYPFSTHYTQIELLARPAVKELFEKFVDHQTTNAVEPYDDPTLQGEIQSFTDAVRPPTAGADYGKTLASILYPNEYAVDLSQTGAASYLGYETKGGLTAVNPTHSTFGGRAVTDDVITISLLATFGNALPALGLIPDDHQEYNCLTTDNVAQNATQKPGATFPYLAAPH